MNAKSKLTTILHSSSQVSSVPQKDSNTDNTDNSSPSQPDFEKKYLTEGFTRHKWISEAAYYKAEARAFEAGSELND